MKKFIHFFFLLTGCFIMAQKNPNKVVKDPLLTVEQKVTVQLVFIERIKELNLAPERLNQYLTIIDDHVFYAIQLNKKRNLTKAQLKSGLDKIIVKQNKALKPILTTEQLALHTKIYDETIGGMMMSRLDEY